MTRHPPWLPLPWLIAWRYLRGERSQILSSTALAALAATGLGVMAMVLAMALMSGYTETLQKKLIGLQGDVMVSPLASADSLEEGQGLLRSARVEGVSFVGRVAYGEGSISSAANPQGLSVVLRGVEVGSLPPILGADGLPLERQPADEPAAGEPGVVGLWLGLGLMRQLEVAPGDIARLVVLDMGGLRPKFRYRSARVLGAFSTGFSEFDTSWILLDREDLVAVRGRDSGVDVLELKLTEEADREAVAARAQQVLGEDWHVQRWEILNRELFTALRLQEALLFFVLGLIVVVSTFNTSSTLVILVRERLHDIGVLTSLGLQPRQLWWVFVTYGAGLGGAGIALGVAAGSAISWAITRFELVRFDPEVAAVYFIDSVPFYVEAGDLLAIVTFSAAITLVACSLPASRASRLRPAEALRDA